MVFSEESGIDGASSSDDTWEEVSDTESVFDEDSIAELLSIDEVDDELFEDDDELFEDDDELFEELELSELVVSSNGKLCLIERKYFAIPVHIASALARLTEALAIPA